LNVTIQQVEPDIKVPMDEFDGKVMYGQKRLQTGEFICIHRPMISEVQPLVIFVKNKKNQTL
jgi:ATP-dependent RNA helicase DDX1